MSQSPYKISGLARRALKKELSDLKRLIKYQPQFLDLCEVYGTPVLFDSGDCLTRWQERLETIKAQLTEKAI